ncbi:MAG: DNA alkylation repair protein [Candidatus Colwellbacteria bacterium]|nr:DNA alkylation repair protein [Candidatus Colwellbacteria bacterium]
MNISKKIKNRLRLVADVDRAISLRRFFKTGRGEYGEGDIFIGVRVPDQRVIAKEYFDGASMDDIDELLKSRVHEDRLTALIIMVMKFGRADKKVKEDIFEFYLSRTERINNWDLVDLSAPYIIGGWMKEGRSVDIIRSLAVSSNIWERRMAIVSNLPLVRDGNISSAMDIAEMLVYDRDDLIHKAVGWVLREVGKKDKGSLKSFLKKHLASMPRTTLRYSIERFSEAERLSYLNHGKRKLN